MRGYGLHADLGGFGGSPAFTPDPPPPALDLKSPSPAPQFSSGGGVAGWRYARESVDSEGFSPYPRSAPRTGRSSRDPPPESWRAAGAALAAQHGESPAAPAMGSPPLPPHGACQLWSPSKRPAAVEPPAVAAQQLGALSVPVPPGMDATSFSAGAAAGERAAFMLAFQQALPGQQALGQLFSAVDALHERLEEETAQWRQLQGGSARTAAQVEAVLQRLDGVERSTLPALQAKWEELACKSPDKLAEVLDALQQAVTLLAHQRERLVAEQQYGGGFGRGGGGGATGRLHWLLLAAAGTAGSLLSRADVAALVLSRKILLTPAAEGEETAAPGISRALGAALFVLAVEAAFQAQRRALARLPTFAQRAVAPAELGMTVARSAVWSAAVVLAAAQTRASCQAASDGVCSSAAEAWARVQLPPWAAALPLVGPMLVRRQQRLEAAAHADEEAGCCEDEEV